MRPSCLLLLAASLLLAPSPPAQGRPNIVLILADDLGYGDVGCYGQRRIQTPRLDRMAAEGLRFTQFYAGSTVCAPSRCVLMTGLHTGHCTVRGNAGKADPTPQTLRPEDLTIAEVLQAAGYRTALIGKWGLGDDPQGTGHPNRQGFTEFFGYLSQHHAHNHYPNYLWRNQERIALPNAGPHIDALGAGWAADRVEYAGDRLTAEALSFLERQQSGPFFLYLSLIAPHANNERRAALGDGTEVPDYGPYAARDWSPPNLGQAAMITRLDTHVGQVLDKLRELGLAENTLVLFSSDNGPHKEGGQDPEFFDPNGPLRGYKRDLTEGGIRVPTLAWWPGRIRGGRETAQVGYFGDFFATAAELAQAPVAEPRDSISLVPTLLEKGDPAPPGVLYWEFHEGGTSQAVLLDGRWKAIRLKRRDAPLQVYDLKHDLGESRDVADSEPEIVRRAEQALLASRGENPFWPLTDAPRVKPAPRKSSSPR